MKPIFTTIENSNYLMIIPDTQASVDGHPVLTYTYSIYKDRFNGSGQYIEKKENELHLLRKNDPDYLGELTFEIPGKIFNYTGVELGGNGLQELIEVITLYRERSELWAF